MTQTISVATDWRERYIPEPNSGCWLWLGTLNTDGYARYGRKGAHRMFYELHVGKIPSGLCACHVCDVRCCVNPDHIFLGTVAENSADCKKKGRAWRPLGEKAPRHKLTRDQVVEIRASPLRNNQLASLYGVSDVAISYIKSRKTWRHV